MRLKACFRAINKDVISKYWWTCGWNQNMLIVINARVGTETAFGNYCHMYISECFFIAKSSAFPIWDDIDLNTWTIHYKKCIIHKLKRWMHFIPRVHYLKRTWLRFCDVQQWWYIQLLMLFSSRLFSLKKNDHKQINTLLYIIIVIWFITDLLNRASRWYQRAS